LNIRRKLLLIFLLTLALLATLGGYAAHLYRNGLAQAEQLRDESLVHVDITNRLQRHMQAATTAWKNVLLRGDEPDKYYQYLSEFYEHERATREHIETLQQAYARDRDMAPLLDRLAAAHLNLGKTLRTALRVYNIEVDNPHIFADRVVAGQESSPMVLLDSVTAAATQHHDRQMAALESQLRQDENLLLLMLVVIGGGSALLFFWLLDKNIGRPAEQATYLANFDPLTGLPNRTLFQDRLQHALAQAGRSSQQVSLLFFDLDHFKSVNDALGHQTGDELLKQVGERLRGAVRESDTPARLGGDEFAVIIENSGNENQISHLAQHIIDVVGQPYEVGNQRAHVSASIGITRYPDDGGDIRQLLKNADAAMYLAKKKGRACFHFYTEALNQAAEQRLALENLLRVAVDNEGFELHYQPQLALSDSRLIGAEALLRFSHDGKAIPPDAFVPVLEDTGLIDKVSQWVLNTACRTAAGWRTRLGFDIRIAVNLSARQLHDANFVDHVAQALSRSGLPSHCLEVEITEHNLIEAQRTGTVLHALGKLGVRLAIDDFGTGYSSLSYLKSFSVDVLKIDRSFIRDITQDDEDNAITTAIIALAHKLGLEVIAEGVETLEQQAFLLQNHCDSVQGFLFSHPLPAAAFEDWSEHRQQRLRSNRRDSGPDLAN